MTAGDTAHPRLGSADAGGPRHHDAGLDEEAILRAAAQIRQRRVAEQLRQAQERRRQAARPRRGGGRARPCCTATAST